jgi:hypothetical protein
MVRGAERLIWAAFRVAVFAVAAFGLAMLGASGCSSSAHAPADGGACGCSIDPTTHIMHMSLDCYCAAYGCENAAPAVCAGSTSAQSWTVACDLNVFSSQTFGGPFYWVTDPSGTLVGIQVGSDTTPYACPSDPTLTSLAVRAGRFPDASCAVRDCSCDAGAGCATPPDASADR